MESAQPQKTPRYSSVLKTIKKDIRPVQAFWIKFNNDWSWNNSAGLAYSLILSMLPMLMAFIAILGLIVGRLNTAAYNRLTQQIVSALSLTPAAEGIIKVALAQLAHESGILGLIAIVLAIFNGSRLFLSMEGYLDIVYHVRPRNPIKQNIMAICMLLLFVILIPITILASSIPTLVATLLRQTPFIRVPGSDLVFSLCGIAGGLIASYMLFQAIYMIVPNQKISFRHSWPGAVIAAVLLELYLLLFPLYVSRFLSSFAGTLGLLILLIFFYYFAMILFLGAEVNAFTQGVRETPYDLATMVHVVTNSPEMKNGAGPKNEAPQSEIRSATEGKSSKK